MHDLFSFGTGTSIKSGEIEPVLRTQTSPLREEIEKLYINYNPNKWHVLVNGLNRLHYTSTRLVQM